MTFLSSALPRFAALLLTLVMLALAPAAAEVRSIPARLVHESLLLDVAYAGDALVAVGERGHVLLSADHGEQWDQVIVPTRVTLTSVYFVDAKRGFAAGHDAVVLRTLDGGRSWEQVYADAEGDRPILDIWFADADTGIAVGAYGLYLETTDGGDSWSQRWIDEDDFHFNRITAAADGDLYLAGEAGRLHRSQDAGESWQLLDSPYEGSFFGLLASEGELLAYGLRGHLYRSADKGDSWQPMETGTEVLLADATRLPNGDLFVAGAGGLMLVQAAGSHGFRPYGWPDRKGFAALEYLSDGALLGVGEMGVRRMQPEQIKAGKGTP